MRKEDNLFTKLFGEKIRKEIADESRMKNITEKEVIREQKEQLNEIIESLEKSINDSRK